MSASPRRFPILLLAAAIVGCGGGGGGGGSAQLSPPTNLTAVQGGSFDDVVVTWTEPVEDVDEYQVEGRMADGPWERLNDGVIPRGTFGGVIQLVESIPELTSFGFRIRSVRGGATSAWSAEATYLRGIRAPTDLAATLVDGPGVELAWANASAVADTLLVERADGNEYGVTGPWSSLPVAFGPTRYRDSEPHELVHHGYRVRYGKGGVWSADASTLVGPVPLLPPVALRATVETAGVRLTWQNRTIAGTKLAVTRWPGGTSVELARDATSWLDPVPHPWPSATYQVAVSAPAEPGAPSSLASCSLPAFQVPGPAGPLDALNPPIPWAYPLRRGPDGFFTWIGADPAGTSTIVRQTASGLDAHPLSFRQLINPQLVLDAAGLPHAVGYTLASGAGQQIVHEWLSPDGWKSEIIAGYAGGGSTAYFAVDGLGRLHLLENVQHCVVSGGSCAMASVPQPDGWSSSGYAALEVASDGTAFVMTEGYGGDVRPVAIATRAPAGGWTVEVVPSDWGYNPEPRLAAGRGGDVGLLYHLNGAVFSMRYKERRGGVWSSSEDVGPTTFSILGLAASPDLSRVVAYGRAGDFVGADLVLYSRGAAGWTGATLASGDQYAPMLGVLASGKAWIAAMPNGTMQSQPWSLWEER